ncbi:MAG TPA: protein-methionine-sulfoxide reductase catalytic subunit MsrP [Pyrinomonadaceae bacterium]|nr:protein-methionine-sulfoxide reductase catalytic subunit MsrP [Pyrinomonadaceae bacterium]
MSKNEVKSSEITPESLYLNRRNFIRAGLLAGTGIVTGLGYRFFNPPPPGEVATTEISNVTQSTAPQTLEKPNTLAEITNYNNYYEFSTTKTAVAGKVANFITRPWTVEVDGMVQKPRVFDIDELLKFDQEERIYRFRCVEAWSMVIPWVGFPLKNLLDLVEPQGTAKYVAFHTYYGGKSSNQDVKLPPGPNGMQSSFSAGIDFPYVEGLRLDEAMHPLTILATGLYGKQMPNQNGAPIRLIVPWKYGFKSIKSIVKITLTDREPPTTWNLAGPEEYGFFSNVNPEVNHPRWSQASERRIGELAMRPTEMFNGYGEQVASLYEGMDLKKYF